MRLSAEDMATVTRRLKRAQGQIGGIIKMIEDERDCQEIVTQLAAVSKALDRAGFAVISTGLKECLTNPDTNDVDLTSLEKLFLSLA